MNGRASFPENDRTKNLKVWYKFPETIGTKVEDLSGHDYHGTYENIPTWGGSMFGSSFLMAGSDSSYITIPKGVLKEVL